MNLNLTNKLSALICGLIFLPLTVTAQNKIVTTSTTEPGPASYHDVENYSALDIRGNGVVYTGTDITLTATYNTNSSGTALANGAYITDRATLSLTDSAITTTGSSGYGINLTGTSAVTLSDVNIETKGVNGHGAYVNASSTLSLTGGSITTGSTGGVGITFTGNSTVTVRDVTIETKGGGGYGINISGTSTLMLTDSAITTGSSYTPGIYFSTYSSGTLEKVNVETKGVNSQAVRANGNAKLTLIGGTITTNSSNSHGIQLDVNSSGTVRDVTVAVKGAGSYGVYVYSFATLTLTDSDISATGNNSYALYISNRSTGTASLNHNTLTGNILVSNTSTLDLTLSGSDTRLIGNATHDAASAINIKIEDGTQLNQLTGNINTLTLQNGATLSSGDSNGGLLLNGAPIAVTTALLTLSDGTILTYNYNSETPLALTGTIDIGEGILIDFSSLTETGLYTVLDWSGATLTGDITSDQFNIATTGVEGAFTVDTENNQLTFNATAVPEPSIYVLLGIGLGILLLTARRRKVQS
jgi:hypothetical protein